MDMYTLKKMKTKKTWLWFGLFFFGLIFIFCLVEGELLMGLLSGFMFLMGIVGLVNIKKQITGEITPYLPGKGYWYYRQSPQSKSTYLTVTQWLLLLFILVFWMSGYFSWYVSIVALLGIYYIQTLFKRRIRLHTVIDDASLFELEELGIIEPEEPVNALYKDFANWTEVPKDAKLCLITPDRLIVIRMASSESGERYDILLWEITGLAIIGTGSLGQGMIITLRMADNDQLIRLTLTGDSHQDSPEQFIFFLLKSLDRVNAETFSSVMSGEEEHRRHHPVESTLTIGTSRPVIRSLDIHESDPSIQRSVPPSMMNEEASMNPAPDNKTGGTSQPTQSSQTDPAQSTPNRRIIDF
ncbi:hypothetical protein [Fontibacillus sp. BL9]|uniref:hypothetical protein n=1 Tax=Fontibacillus sp. BL9 TaxID=3389971 RepID=UPI00397DDBD6